MSTVVAIHQPNFYPWLGFFDKWVRADVIVFLDDVQFPKTGGVWTNRTGILYQGGRAWLTASIDRAFHGVREIREIELARDPAWREKLMRKFEQAYAAAPKREEARSLLAADLFGGQSLLIDLNVDSLRTIGTTLGLDGGKIVLSSSLGVSAVSTERLVAIVEKVGGDVYLCGGGAAGYQQDELFAHAGIEVRYQNFQHPTYTQSGASPLVSGLSILDAFSFIGIDCVRRLLQSGGQR